MEFLPFTRPTIDEETIAAVAGVLRSGWLASGPKVQEFEQALGRYLGGRTVRSVTSGTIALEIALRVAGIGPGDEVITPAMSFAATANVIVRAGARPVFVDIEPGSRNIDLTLAERAITAQTRAILPVHFAGLPVDMDQLYALAGRHGLRVIEDAAHAIGSAWRGRKLGSFGDLVCFSFHPNKNMTTIEGGALVASDPAEVAAIERHRWHGLTRNADGTADVTMPGGKANLSDVSAQIGLKQLARLDEFNARRQALVQGYFSGLAGLPGVVLPARSDTDHSWHLFAPLLPFAEMGMTRGEFIEQMRLRGIAVGVHYPAIHLFSYYRSLGYREGDFPVAERVGRETVTLPLFPAMAEADVERVCSEVRSLVGGGRR